MAHSYKHHLSTLSASRLLDIMRKLKYSVRRKTMNQIYIYHS